MNRTYKIVIVVIGGDNDSDFKSVQIHVQAVRILTRNILGWYNFPESWIYNVHVYIKRVFKMTAWWPYFKFYGVLQTRTRTV